MYVRLRRKFQRVAIGFLLKAVDIGLRSVGYRRVTWLLLRCSPRPNPLREQLPRTVAISRLVSSVSVEPQVQVTCLRRTVLTWWLLRWMNIPSEVRIGVNLASGHAWLEHHGCVVNDRPDVAEQFPVIYSDELAPERVFKPL